MSTSVISRCIRIGLVLKQQLNHRPVPQRGSYKQWSVAVDCGKRWVSLVLEQCSHDVRMALMRGDVKRSCSRRSRLIDFCFVGDKKQYEICMALLCGDI